MGEGEAKGLRYKMLRFSVFLSHTEPKLRYAEGKGAKILRLSRYVISGRSHRRRTEYVTVTTLGAEGEGGGMSSPV